MQTVTLNNGVNMPIVGFGTFLITDPAECERSVLDAIQSGYRHIDTAEAYGNEEYVGNAISRCGVPREELFITTKVNFKTYETETARATVRESLKKLQVEYLDLVLLHWPFANYYAAWRVLEEFYEAGTIKAIGVSNFSPDRLIDLIHYNKVVPAVNQIETHLLCQRWEENKWMQQYDVRHEAYAPLGQGRKNEMFEHPALLAIAKAHGKTPAQVALRYLTQRGIAVIPKSVNLNRMQENIDLFDFELSQKDMGALRGMDEVVPMIGNPQSPDLVQSSLNW